MTRDEALKLWNDNQGCIIDRLAAIGVLKLDDPKSAETTFENAWLRAGYGHTALSNIGGILAEHKLKIVEK